MQKLKFHCQLTTDHCLLTIPEIRNPNSEISFVPRQLLPDIDLRTCTLCGDCLVVCPTECLSVAREVEIVLAPQTCINCAVCEAVCPVTAITMRTQDW